MASRKTQGRVLQGAYVTATEESQGIVVPGGGLEPPQPCGLRILRAIKLTLHDIAIERKKSHKLLFFKGLRHPRILQYLAANRKKSQGQVAPKVALKTNFAELFCCYAIHY
jgi:hypothetical protein